MSQICYVPLHDQFLYDIGHCGAEFRLVITYNHEEGVVTPLDEGFGLQVRFGGPCCVVAEAPLGVPDVVVDCADDSLVASPVLVQSDSQDLVIGLNRWMIRGAPLIESNHRVDGRPSEPIECLVVVANHCERSTKPAHGHVDSLLNWVGVLVLVHYHVTDPLPSTLLVWLEEARSRRALQKA